MLTVCLSHSIVKPYLLDDSYLDVACNLFGFPVQTRIHMFVPSNDTRAVSSARIFSFTRAHLNIAAVRHAAPARIGPARPVEVVCERDWFAQAHDRNGTTAAAASS